MDDVVLEVSGAFSSVVLGALSFVTGGDGFSLTLVHPHDNNNPITAMVASSLAGKQFFILGYWSLNYVLPFLNTSI